jgi:hypothetical protein
MDVSLLPYGFCGSPVASIMAHCWSTLYDKRPIEVSSIKRCAFSTMQSLQSFPNFPWYRKIPETYFSVVDLSAFQRLAVVAPSCTSSIIAHGSQQIRPRWAWSQIRPIPNESTAAGAWMLGWQVTNHPSIHWDQPAALASALTFWQRWQLCFFSTNSEPWKSRTVQVFGGFRGGTMLLVARKREEEFKYTQKWPQDISRLFKSHKTHFSCHAC